MALEEDARLTALFLWTLQSTERERTNNRQETDEEDDEIIRGRSRGFSLIFDVVRRFARPLVVHLPDWEGRITETKKGVVRLLAVAERTTQLFGEGRAQTVADELEYGSDGNLQMMLFPELQGGNVPGIRGRRRRAKVADEEFETKWEATTLDRVHVAMLLQAGGRAHALRELLKAEHDRGE